MTYDCLMYMPSDCLLCTILSCMTFLYMPFDCLVCATLLYVTALHVQRWLQVLIRLVYLHTSLRNFTHAEVCYHHQPSVQILDMTVLCAAMFLMFSLVFLLLSPTRVGSTLHCAVSHAFLPHRIHEWNGSRKSTSPKHRSCVVHFY